jgi:putative NIF3 family GTP cyclohydrolase 1 type 2
VADPLTLAELAARTQSFLGAEHARFVGQSSADVSKVAIACGSGGSLLEPAVAAECDALVTGEMTFHHCLEAEARGVSVVLAGHFASERFALLSLADYLTDQLVDAQVWASRHESNPIRMADD